MLERKATTQAGTNIRNEVKDNSWRHHEGFHRMHVSSGASAEGEGDGDGKNLMVNDEALTSPRGRVDGGSGEPAHHPAMRADAYRAHAPSSSRGGEGRRAFSDASPPQKESGSVRDQRTRRRFGGDRRAAGWYSTGRCCEPGPAGGEGVGCGCGSPPPPPPPFDQ